MYLTFYKQTFAQTRLGWLLLFIQTMYSKPKSSNFFVQLMMTIIAWLAEMGMGIIRAAQSRNHTNSPGESRGEFSPSDITALQRFMSEGWKCGNMP